ncbi:MAG: hypothetical protein ACOH2R_24175 [Pseudomonas sp.]
MINHPPLTDAIVVALARLIDDSQLADKWEPTHYDLDVLVAQVKLSAGDQPGRGGRPIGKAKRVRGALNWALANNHQGGEALIPALISIVQGCGGFRPQSRNYCGMEAIANLASAIASHGWELSLDGNLAPTVLEAMKGQRLTDALVSYADTRAAAAFIYPYDSSADEIASGRALQKTVAGQDCLHVATAG